jgi:hypothetical protein
MKRRLSEAVVQQIMSQLLERFGEPIGDAQGDGQGVPSSHKKEDMGNRGFGAKLEGHTCDECGGMMGMDEHECTSCGMMPKALPPAGGEVATAVVVVKGGPNGGGAAPNGRFAAGVAKPKDMDIPPEALPKKGKPAGPSAPPSRPVKA